MVERFDIVIAGGGIAGSVAATALSRLGYEILILEPGMHAERRLGGELLHPLGVAGLAGLGMLDQVLAKGAAAIDGFHFWDSVGEVRLSYNDASGHSALALDHAVLRATLLESACWKPGVTLRAARVVAVQDRGDGVRLRASAAEGEQEIDCRLLIGADGAQSRVRELAGLAMRRHRVSSICAVSVPDEALPDQRYGHLFIGGKSATLAYRFGEDRARVMFDYSGRAPTREDLVGLLPGSVVPELARAIAVAVHEQRPRHINTFLVIVPRPRRGRVLLVGDAAGTCHPLTASGMSACVADALSLGAALGAMPHSIDAALARHVAARNQAQLSRLALASAMHEVMTSRAPEFAHIRAGMMRYWRSAEGGSRAVALLSMKESRPRRVFGAMLGAAYHGMFGRTAPCPGFAGRVKLAAGLARLLLRYGLGLFGGIRLLPAPLGGERPA